MRTLNCECGWSCRKQLQEANKLLKLHNRLTHKKATPTPNPFSQEQGLQGLTRSKNGNPIHVPLTGVYLNTIEGKFVPI